MNGVRAASLHKLCELYIMSGCRCTQVHYLVMPAEELQMRLCTVCLQHVGTVYAGQLEELLYIISTLVTSKD